MSDLLAVSIPGPVEDQIGRDFVLATFAEGKRLSRADLSLLVAPTGGTVTVRFRDLPDSNDSLDVVFADGDDTAGADGQVDVIPGGQLAATILAATGGAEDLSGNLQIADVFTDQQPGAEDLVDLSAVKALDEITGNEHDDALQLLVTGVSRLFARYVRRPLRLTTLVEVRSGADLERLALDHPIAAVEAVSIDGVALDAEAYGFDETPFQTARVLERIDGRPWPRGRRNLSIEYSTGFDPIPAELATACAHEVLFAWRQLGASGISRLGLKQQVIDGGGTSTFVDFELSRSAKIVLDTYRVRPT
jgi:hypothetical protein